MMGFLGESYWLEMHTHLVEGSVFYIFDFYFVRIFFILFYFCARGWWSGQQSTSYFPPSEQPENPD